jgi:uncharacterized protein YjbJ (UPF0337 family)
VIRGLRGYVQVGFRNCRRRYPHPAAQGQKGDVMSINRYQVKGRVAQAKGSIKEASGRLVGNKALQAKGSMQKNLGKVQAKLGDIQKHVQGILK